MDKTITTTKRTIAPDQRMAAKALLLDHSFDLLHGGQLIVHFGPGRVPRYIEVREHIKEPSSPSIDKVA